MKTQFTPGPWTLCETSQGRDMAVTIADQELAVVWNAGPQCGAVEVREEALATARAIAALPDLVAALERINEYSLNSAHSENVLRGTICVMAETALAKVRG